MTVADACAELALLAPMLGPALQRDNAGGSRATRWEATLSPVNTDVLSVMITLRHEIPAAAMRCCHIVHEPWQERTMAACLLALPRFADRMVTLTLVTEVRQLEDATRLWVRITKRALGLRTPDIPLGAHDPTCQAEPPGDLYLIGSEAFVDPRDLTAPPRWEHDPRVYCTACGQVWVQAEWGLLERLIGQARSEQERATA